MKFSIRDLLWLTVVVALAVAWWVYHHYLADDAQVTREQKARIRDFERKLKVGVHSVPDSGPGAPVGGSGSLKN